MASQFRETRLWRSVALFSTGALITLACSKVKVSWDQHASAAAPTSGVSAATAAAAPREKP